MNHPDPENGYLNDHARLMVWSYRHLTGRDLIGSGLKPPGEILFHAPFALVSHDTGDDPVFNYGNQTALALFEMSWEEFTRLESRKSAEPENRSDRKHLLDTVSRQGYIDSYSGIRISKKGTRFIIDNATVWNLIDDRGHYHGQAAMFRQWTPL